MYALKVSKAGNSTCLLLTKAAAAKLAVSKGDTVYLTDAPDGSLLVSAHDPSFARQMAAAERVMRRHRNVLKALASK